MKMAECVVNTCIVSFVRKFVNSLICKKKNTGTLTTVSFIHKNNRQKFRLKTEWSKVSIS